MIELLKFAYVNNRPADDQGGTKKGLKEGPSMENVF